MSERTTKIEEMLMRIAAEYIEKESNKTSLITVTRTEITPDLRQAKVFITVYPETKENEVVDFLKRQRSELRDFVKKRMIVKVIPFLDVEIDKGEKARIAIENALRSQ